MGLIKSILPSVLAGVGIGTLFYAIGGMTVPIGALGQLTPYIMSAIGFVFPVAIGLAKAWSK